MADLQLAVGHLAAVDQIAADLAARGRLCDRVRPAVGPQPPARGQQHVESGRIGALGVHDLAVGQIEGAAVTYQHARGPLVSESDEHRGNGRSHWSTSPSARFFRRSRASARLPMSRSSQRCKNTLLSKPVSTKRTT